MNRSARIVAAAGALLLLAGCSGAGNQGSTSGFVSGNGQITVVNAADRKAAPVLTGKDLHGKPLSTADFAGKTIVVNVWGPWCAPCRKEAPSLKTVADEYADKGVQFVGILNRSDNATALSFNRKLRIGYPSFADEGGSLELGFVRSLPTRAIPTTWIIDPSGKVAVRVMDEVTASTLANLIDDVQKSAS
jgi:thiol-disulfide isomerase/thioredoxin